MFDDASSPIVFESDYRWNLRSVSFSVGIALAPKSAETSDVCSTAAALSAKIDSRSQSEPASKSRKRPQKPTFDAPNPWNAALFVPRGLAGMTLPQIERLALLETLVACGGNRSRAARKLGVSEKTIYNKIRRYKIDAETLERFAASYYPN